VYVPFIHDFLTELAAKTGSASTQGLDALVVQAFLLDRVRDRSTESCRLLATALRSFLRFLHLRGETPIDLSRSSGVAPDRYCPSDPLITFLESL